LDCRGEEERVEKGQGARGKSEQHLPFQLVTQEGQSKADFIAKMSISSKEARETAWWLRLAIASKVLKSSDVEWELSESNQLRFMIRAAIRTARSSPDRGR